MYIIKNIFLTIYNPSFILSFFKRKRRKTQSQFMIIQSQLITLQSELMTTQS